MKTKPLHTKHRITGSLSLCTYHIAMQCYDAKFAIQVMCEVCKSRVEPSHPRHLASPNWQELAAMLGEYLHRCDSLGSDLEARRTS